MSDFHVTGVTGRNQLEFIRVLPSFGRTEACAGHRRCPNTVGNLPYDSNDKSKFTAYSFIQTGQPNAIETRQEDMVNGRDRAVEAVFCHGLTGGLSGCSGSSDGAAKGI